MTVIVIANKAAQTDLHISAFIVYIHFFRAEYDARHALKNLLNLSKP